MVNWTIVFKPMQVSAVSAMPYKKLWKIIIHLPVRPFNFFYLLPVNPEQAVEGGFVWSKFSPSDPECSSPDWCCKDPYRAHQSPLTLVNIRQVLGA